MSRSAIGRPFIFAPVCTGFDNSVSLATDFSIDVRVYFEDTDFGGVVYYANYLKFMERARTEYLRTLGYKQSQLFDDQRRMFVVRSAHLEYKAPARFDDVLSVTVKVEQLRKASIRFSQCCCRKDNSSHGVTETLVTGDILIACLDADSFKPCAIPGNLKTVLNT